jgi:hypothetical protein
MLTGVAAAVSTVSTVSSAVTALATSTRAFVSGAPATCSLAF